MKHCSNTDPSSIHHCELLGIKVDQLHTTDLHERICQVIQNSEKALILNANVQLINLAVNDSELRFFMNSADAVFCDGAGVQLGAAVLGHHIPERITYADWMWQLAELAESNGFTFFFLGARPGVANKAADNLKARYPNIRTAGTQHGYFDKSPGSVENEAVIEKINAIKPNILIVGFGMPLQERWLMENWDQIDANIALTGGAVFDYISGELKRAPKWMTDNGLEWLGRLIIEPRRLWKRYIIGNPLFLWRVLKQRLGLLKLK